MLLGDPLLEFDVDFSPETGILKPEDARRLQEPPQLTSIRVQPAAPQLGLDESLVFLAEPLDQHGRLMAGIAVRWSATGGTIDAQTGRFESDSAGAFSVQASAGGISESVTVHVRVPESVSDQTSDTENDAADESGISWQGAGPPQALNNFYLRVLAALAGYDLRLEVTVSLKPPEGSGDVLADQMKTALSGLGLDAEALDWSR